jgi:hypothetical protein
MDDLDSTFAAFNKSKLEFMGQFIQNASTSVGPEEHYGQGFRQGSADGRSFSMMIYFCILRS